MSPPAAKLPYAGYRFPAEVISQAVWLYFRFPLGLRMVKKMLAALGRGRYQRGGAGGHRHGHRTRRLTGSFGPVEIAVPRARLCAEDGAARE